MLFFAMPGPIDSMAELWCHDQPKGRRRIPCPILTLRQFNDLTSIFEEKETVNFDRV